MLGFLLGAKRYFVERREKAPSRDAQAPSPRPKVKMCNQVSRLALQYTSSLGFLGKIADKVVDCLAFDLRVKPR